MKCLNEFWLELMNRAPVVSKPKAIICPRMEVGWIFCQDPNPVEV